jgi:hypothetical protein
VRIQYAALNDLESVIKDLTKLGKGRLVLFFDASAGWVATDEVEVLPSKDGPGAFEFKGKAYGDWMRPHVANAVSALGAVRFLPASDMDKLFRKPIPLAAPTAGMAPAPGPAPLAAGAKPPAGQQIAGGQTQQAKKQATGASGSTTAQAGSTKR